MKHKFRLGQRLRDTVTGLEGIATARLEYLNGCMQYCISPSVDKDGKRVEGWYVDDQQLICVGDGIAKSSTGRLLSSLRSSLMGDGEAAAVPATGGPSTREPQT